MLKVRLSKSPPALIFGLTGRFDFLSIEGIDSLIMGSQEWGCQQIVFDFSSTTWIDPIVVGQLFVWYHKMKPHQVKLSIANPQHRIREILEKSHITKLLPIESLDSEAVHQNGTIQ